MWTLATSVSVQFQHLQNQLYQDTKLMLESLSATNHTHSPAGIEQVQAFVLVTKYESMKAPKQQAYLTAGRAVRLVQLMRLHEIDSPSAYATTVPTKSFLETEEQRRVFWMSYFLDTFLTMLNCLPLTTNEHVVFIRLPAPEEEFQCSQNVLGNFLSAAIFEQSPQTQSSFIQWAIFANISERSLFYGQQHNISTFYGGAPVDYSIQYQWLDDILTARLQILSQYNPSPTETHDPILLFTSIIGQVAIMALCKGMEVKLAADSDGGTSVVACQLRALTAATQIVKFAKALTGFPIFKASSALFKIHPLMPVTLGFCAGYFYENRLYHPSFKSHLQELLNVLRQLKNVSDPSQSYLDLLELPEIVGTGTLP
ncbi:Citrinin biosynthesis transcriptional activator ctnR [Lachnellula arida]|uniref:Citrinin biosynthesis transcriptional activator ctnR n=1 Tax=Lachnellula arida TaxID=1316785 RepID=A0A8T9BBB4_9HELO|nr:Citrinin biosynthesis transcriptional activator ctnR [Lachnellula arida]